MPKLIENRPSHKEITGKIRQAGIAAGQGRIEYLEYEIIAQDALNLDITIEELPGVLVKFLKKTKPDYYCGNRPPQRSDENRIRDGELLALTGFLSRIGKNIYVKFTLKDERRYVVSFHEDRPDQEGQ